MPLRLLLLQLLPILVFLAVDAFVADPAWAIGSALVFVAGQTAWTWRRERRLDRFVLLDALLIGGLGAVSLLSHDELFFKLKPAIIEGLMVGLLLLLALGNERLIRGYLGRYAAALRPGQALDERALPLLRRLLAAMALLTAAHAALTVLAALRWSRQSWAWVSGPGFYLLLLPLVGWALYRRLVVMRRSRAPSGAPRVSGRRRG